MLTETSQEVEPRDAPTDVTKLGVDAEGDIHHYSRIASNVYVLNLDGELVREETVEGRDLPRWIGYVDTKRGWASLNYADSLEAIIRDALSGAQDAEVDQ